MQAVFSRRTYAVKTSVSAVPEGLSDGCKGAPLKPGTRLPLVGDESLMKKKVHGTRGAPAQSNLRWGCDPQLPDKIPTSIILAPHPHLGDESLMKKKAHGTSDASTSDESLMKKKAHGTSDAPAQSNLRWGCDPQLADKICNFNRHYAEHSGYWTGTNFLKEVDRNGETVFYDSNTGKSLFVAPRGRSFAEWEAESRSHGWPSFRDEEVIWDDVRVLPDGETVSLAGTHLGHNLPDRTGNRYCINLVSVAAQGKQ
eukprot:gene4982-34760_t